MIYFSDCANSLADGRGFSCNDYYGAPSRWAMIEHICETLKDMPSLKYPSPTTGVFISVDTETSRKCGYSSSKYYSMFQIPLFNVLGPGNGYWFEYFSDNQLESRKIDLRKFKIIYVPNATYERQIAVDLLLEYVKRGGVLVLGSPDAFRYDLDGRDRSDEIAKAIGVKIDGKNKLADTVLKISDPLLQSGIDENSISLNGLRGFEIKPRGDARVLGALGDGKPEIIENRYGAGKFIVFAHNPFRILESSGWNKLFDNLQKSVKCEGARLIWRFKFPDGNFAYQPRKQKCLTGNYFEWRLNKAVPKYNDSPGGYYFFSLPSDAPIKGDCKRIPFSKGRLTNRTLAPKSPSCVAGKKGRRSNISDWVVSWSTLKPLSITFVFNDPVVPGRVNIFFQGQLPDFILTTSVDGAIFKQVRAFKGSDSGIGEVLKYTSNFVSAPCRFIRLELSERKRKLTIGEMEIWGNMKQ